MVSSTAAIVPAYNEEEGVAQVVRDLLQLGVDVIVVDDGSADRTASLAHAAGASVISLPTNLGIGGALQAGFRLAHARGYEAVFQFDADGQHGAAHVETLLAPIRDGTADMVVGSRFGDGSGAYAVEAHRRIVMRFLAWLLSRMVGRTLTDVSSGFRGFGTKAVALFAHEYPHDYMESVEALVIAARAGLRIEEVSVTMYEREWGVASNRSFRAAVKTFRMLTSVVLIRLRPVRRAPWAS